MWRILRPVRMVLLTLLIKQVILSTRCGCSSLPVLMTPRVRRDSSYITMVMAKRCTKCIFYGDAAALAFGGQSDPKVIVGLDNQMKWRDFSIGFLLAYYGGHKMFCLPFRDRFEGDFYGPVASYYLDSWTPENPSDVPAIGQWAHSSSTDSSPDVSSRALHDADFIKFRNIIFGYDVPVSVLRHLGVNRCSLRFQINDPKAVWTKDKVDFDPETGGLRIPSSYVFGLNINL